MQIYILRLRPPDLKMEKNQLSPFPLLYQPAKEFRRCSLEEKNSLHHRAFLFLLKVESAKSKEGWGGELKP